MNTIELFLAPVPPILVIIAFLAHWVTLIPLKTSSGRLPFCRGAYLGLSLQLLLYAWLLTALTGLLSGFLFIALGMLFSSLGDFFNLQFASVKKKITEPLVPGIFSFMIAQVFYILFICSQVSPGILLREGYLTILLPLLILVPAVLFRFTVYNPKRPKVMMLSALVYGMILGTTSALAFSAALALGGAWYVVAAGFLFFLLSDAVMGQTTIRGEHPVYEFQVPWITYLAAQGLIIYGSLLVFAGGWS